MAMTSWLTLALVCLVYLGLGLWVVSQIFPGDDQDDDVEVDRSGARAGRGGGMRPRQDRRTGARTG
jgi:hypothetical protein